MQLKLKAVGTTLKIVNPLQIVSTQRYNDTCKFEFDSSWDGFNKTAVFYSDSTDTKLVLLSNDTCVIPWENLVKTGILYIGVFGTKDTITRPTNFVTHEIVQGAYIEGTTPSEPTQDIYAQILAKMEQFSSAENDRNTAEAERIASELQRKADELVRKNQETERQNNTTTAISNAVTATQATNQAIASANNAANKALLAVEELSLVEVNMDGGGAADQELYDSYDGGVA